MITLVKLIIWVPKTAIDPKKLSFRRKNYLTGFFRGLGRMSAGLIAAFILICLFVIQAWVVEVTTGYEEIINIEELLPLEIRKTTSSR